MFIKRFIAIFLVLLMFLSMCTLCTSALTEEEITSPSAVLIEPTTLKILYEKNPHERRACASITKVMTLLLVMEAIEEGKIAYDDVVTTSQHAKSMGGSDIWLEVGEQMTVDEMIKATAVASANDAAVALAEHLCGSESDFVALMNTRAKELGMENTVFKNCNGLDEEGHLTTAFDVALMSAELIKHEKIFEYTTIWIDTLRDGETQIVNTNKLLKSYDGITGLKTGTTGDAGSCISATAQRNSMSLVGVVLGATTGTERFKDAAALLDFGFANYEILKFDAKKSELKEIEVKNGMQKSVNVECKGITNMVVAKGSKERVEQSVKLKESIDAPVEKGQKVGTLTYTLDDEKVSVFDVVTSKEVEKMTFKAVFFELMNALVAM
ncbi:MAG: D-alanyl-D-alanine carboxypeptidase [Ruminococcaceae bacterium]|nr:D-alanyl-D-alanine carboxypeptidase [Oscillospiraceae bacterium]